MNKQVYRYKENKEKILQAINMIADPIRETMSPKGRNVIFETEDGEYTSTNDGVTIAKAIEVADPVQNAIIQIIKGASLKSDIVGDGTSTAVLLSKIATEEGFKLKENGLNEMDIKKEFEKFGEDLIGILKKKAIKIKNDNDLRNVAFISSNNDPVIADDVLKIFKIIGEDGLGFYEPNNKPETEIVEEKGFKIEQGMFSPELRTANNFSAIYKNTPVLITDKRLYYPEEAETILNTVLDAGYKSVVVVARDFLGQSVNTFIANHTQGVIKVLLIKDPRVTEKDNATLHDLATFLGGKVISEKTGSLVDKLKIDDFVIAKRVYSDMYQSLIGSQEENSKKLKSRVKELKAQLVKSPEDSDLKKRIASLTNGSVIIKIGGSTAIEMKERRYRYEDAIAATRTAMKGGYLVGGGVSVLKAFDSKRYPDEYRSAFRKFCEANVRQIAENCGKHPAYIIDNTLNLGPNFGYNALTDKFSDLLKDGVVDPYLVTEMAIRNSISVAGQIISGNFIITNDRSEHEEPATS